MQRPFLGKRSSFSNFVPSSRNTINRDEEEQMYNLSQTGNGDGSFKMNRPAPLTTTNVISPTSNRTIHNVSMQSTYLPRRAAYFESHWPLYAAEWGESNVAVGTFSEDQTNRIQTLSMSNTMDAFSIDFSLVSEAAIPFPATKIGWEPLINRSGAPKLLSTGDYLRLWEYLPDGKLNQRSALVNKSKSDVMPPLTSFDWNKVDPSLVITSSIDTTCTIWDITTSSAKTQLIAHDSEVYDVGFVAGSTEIFASVGADGSVRVFDLRSLDHSTIIYEPSNPLPLVRIATNPQDRHIMAAIAHESNKIFVLDIRSPGVPVAVLQGHYSTVNAIEWAPSTCTTKLSSQTSRHLLASGGDDYNANIWDLTNPDSPIYVYNDSSEVNNITWSPNGDWLGIVSGRQFQGVRIPN